MFAVGNNLNRAHNYFQDFWKRFSIFNKAQQLQLNRKRKQIRKRERGRSPPGPYLCWPAHLACASHHPPLPVGRGVSPARAPAATSCFHLLLPPRPHPSATETPSTSLHSSPLSPGLPHPLPRWPSAILAAVRRRRHQSHPLAPPTSPIAPPRRPGPLR